MFGKRGRPFKKREGEGILLDHIRSGPIKFLLSVEPLGNSAGLNIGARGNT